MIGYDLFNFILLYIKNKINGLIKSLKEIESPKLPKEITLLLKELYDIIRRIISR